MAELEVRNHDQADETRPFVDKGRVEIVNLAGGVVGRGTFEPGWRWSEHVKPIAGTESCQAPHMGYCVSGRMVVRMDDGTEKEVGPGDVLIVRSARSPTWSRNDRSRTGARASGNGRSPWRCSDPMDAEGPPEPPEGARRHARTAGRVSRQARAPGSLRPPALPSRPLPRAPALDRP
jgi:quercetin dioxygenase-like cupin family protein